MKKKKILIICLIVVFLCLAGGGIYVASRLMIKFPDYVSYGIYCQTYSDKGLYYLKGNVLHLLDIETGKDTVVCNKANCNHDTKDCYAQTIGFAPDLMCYNGCVFVSAADSRIYSNEDDETCYEGEVELKYVSEDGSREKVIYTADMGAVTSMKAVDGVVYFTAYVYHDGFKVNEYKFDWTLYAYDLRWNKLKKLKTYYADDSHETSGLEIVSGNSRELYVQYEEYFTDGSSCGSVMKYEDGEFTVVDTIDDLSGYPSYLIDEDRQFLFCDYTDDAGEWEIAYETNPDFAEKKELFMVDGTVDVMHEYMYLINSDYNKALYDYNTGEWYIANTSFTNEGKYISDVYMIDSEKDIIYIDGHDYTGMQPGDIFYEDKSDKQAVRWSAFLEKYFIPLSEVPEADRAGLTWLRIPE